LVVILEGDLLLPLPLAQVRSEGNQLPLAKFRLQHHLAVIAKTRQVKGRLPKIRAPGVKIDHIALC
jgi:hypothetical protein